MKNTGQILRENREKLGLTIHEISLALKINSRIIKAMEEGNTAQLPPRTFLRGFVQSYATYLKLDMDHFMEVFQGELEPERPDLSNEPALTIPNSEKKAPAPTWQKMLFWNGNSPKFASLLIGGVALTIVAAIVLISRTIEKYQQEKYQQDRIIAPTETVQTGEPTVQNEAANEAGSEDSREDAAEEAAEKTAEKVAAKSPMTPVPVSSLPAANSPTAANNVKPETGKIVQVIKPEVPAKPEAKKAEVAKQAEPKAKVLPEKTPPVAAVAAPEKKPAIPKEPVKAPTVPEKIAAKPSEPVADKAPASLPPKGVPQELIMEAMDKVSVEVQIDGAAPQTFDMGADQIRTVKAKKSLKVKLSDGGAVSLIHNGKDTGVPGNLGKPLSLTYPK